VNRIVVGIGGMVALLNQGKKLPNDKWIEAVVIEQVVDLKEKKIVSVMRGVMKISNLSDRLTSKG